MKITTGEWRSSRSNDWGLLSFSVSLSLLLLANTANRFTKFRRNIIGAEKNELTLLYSVLIKKNIVLLLMVTRYIGNMIAFLRCHYAYLSQASYQRSITIKYCIPAIAMQRSPAASTRLLVFSEAVKINCVTINEAATCDASLQVLCNAACVKTQHC